METIQSFIKQVQKKEIDIVDYTHKALKEIKEINKEYNYFINITEDLALNLAEKVKRKPNGKLSGLFISVKDDICVKDIECTCGSEILRSYKPPFNATVIEKIIKEGAIIIGKTSQDEFGFGSFSTNTKTTPKNPFDKSRSCGGSSGGSAGITQKILFPHLSLAESTGGSIANPASFCGISGLTPTYGLVSRYGLIDYASSLDKIGTMSKSPEDAFYLLDIIKGSDPKDQTSLNKELTKPKKKLKIAIIKESLNINKEIKDLILSKVKNYDLISLPNVEKYSIPTYYIIALSEASTNLAKYTGLRYGQTEPLNKEYNEFFTEVRSKHFSKESKRRIILGTFARMAGYREAFYLKAMKTRTLIINEYKKAFQKYDILISPTMPILPPKFTEINKLTPLENYIMDILTVGPNLAGLPHISLNSGFINNLPVGLMAISDHLNENNLLEFSKIIKE